MLEGLRTRLDILDFPLLIVTTDNPNAISRFVQEVFPGVKEFQDVFHLILRYMCCVLGGVESPFFLQIASDVSDCVYVAKATPTTVAIYRDKADQQRRLEAFGSRWTAVGAWNASFTNVHAAQLKHVREGRCSHAGKGLLIQLVALTPRSVPGLKATSSPLEGSFKAFSALHRGQPCGLLRMCDDGHQLVLEHNVSVARKDARTNTPFLQSTEGCWDLDLVERANAADAEVETGEHPPFDNVASGERNGLVNVES
jgi:hypothetical protein